MVTALELFLTGLTLGIGPCSAFCLPMLIPYVAGTQDRWRGGVRATLIFALFRLLAYVILGLAAGLSGELLVGFLGQEEFGLVVWSLGGSFTALLGMLMLLGREASSRVNPLFTALRRHTMGDSLKSMGLLGFVVGITPCAPLLGILSYIAFTVEDMFTGAFYALCFGLGTSIITPITLAETIAASE